MNLYSELGLRRGGATRARPRPLGERVCGTRRAERREGFTVSGDNEEEQERMG